MKPVLVQVRFLKEEKGFTLSEMMVTITIMMIVFFALYSIFDTSVRIFSYGSNKVEAAESARLGLERMEREIRAAYPLDANDQDSPLFFSANGTSTPSAMGDPQADPWPYQITFGNELGAEGEGNGKIDCPDDNNCEYITYKLTDDNEASNAECTDSPCDLRRVNTDDSTEVGNPVVENAVVPDGLDFTYLKSDGVTEAATEGEIAKVRVSLKIVVHQGTDTEATQQLTTVIDLRNRQ